MTHSSKSGESRGDPAASEPVQLLAPDGSLTEHETYSAYVDALDGQQLRELYRHMRIERRLDEEATSLQRQGQLALWVPAWGQEAAQIGTVTALRSTDMIFPTYREHAMALYRGITVDQIITQFRAASHSGWDPYAHHFQVYTVVLAAQTLHAAGWAMAGVADAAREPSKGAPVSDEVVVACLGDGASSQGDVHESMVFASSYELPVLYFIQNNHWAISVPTVRQSRTPLADRARGYGFEGIRVDGNDVLASYAVAAHAVAQMRQKRGPKLIEAVTYRMGAHTTADDPTKYRGAEEVAQWQAKDPISRYKTWLTHADHADQSFFDDVEAEAKDAATQMRKAIASVDVVDLESVFDTVYAEPHSQVDREKAWMKDYEAGFAENDTSPVPKEGAR